MPFRRLQSALLAALALSTLLAGCGGGSGSGASVAPPPPATTYAATAGVVQKGPFAAGSSVTAQELGLNLSATGGRYTYATTSDRGAFKPDAAFRSPYVDVTATGLYADEVSGGTSDGPVTLQSYADLNTENVLGVNLLTTLAHARTNALVVQNALAFPAARAQAEREVLAAFGIAAGGIGPFATLDIGGATEGDHLLAALSSLVVQGRTAAEVGALIAALQADIGAHGALTDGARLQALATSAQALNMNAVAAHLGTLYAASFDAGALAQWIDQDGDGVIGHDQFRVDDATAAATFTLPADLVAARANTPVSLTAGQLSINGAPAAAPATLHAGDIVTITAPGALPDGAFRAYLQAGRTPIARVTFIKGLAALAVTPAAGTLPIGLAQRFVATGTFDDGSTADLSGDVTWASSAPAVADIGAATGLSDALTLGTTTISATAGSVTGTRALNTVAATIQSLAIAPATLQTGVGITRHLVATGTYSDGSTRDVSAAATWSAGTAGVAAVGNGAISGLALGSTGVTATIGTVSASAAVAVTTDTWTAAPAMPTERVAGHTATLLANGRLLVAGGVKSGGAGTAGVDLFDPVTATWTPVAPMTVMRASHTATRLADGRVLVAGGSSVSAQAALGYLNLASAEIYDPVANTWTATPDMSVARSHHTATLLPGGQVLVVGGEDVHYLVGGTAELYDPATNTWSPTRLPPLTPRSHHTATLLPSGLVLIAGGFDIVQGTLTPLGSAELYDPVLHGTATTPSGRAFTATTPMAFPHQGHSATLLPDGRVLVAGGATPQSELYDPGTALWAPLPALAATHTAHGAVLLPDGQVLVVGGTQFARPAAERFDPATGLWSAAAAMQVIRDRATATLLEDGSVMVCGGAPDSAGIDCETYW